MLDLSIVPVPPKSVRFALQDVQWQSCLESWTTITTMALRFSDEDAHAIVGHSTSTFLVSYLHEYRKELQDELSDTSRRLSAAQTLARNVFLLTIRLFRISDPPQSLLSLDVLLDFVEIYGPHNVKAIRAAVDAAIERASDTLEDSIATMNFGARLQALSLLLSISSFGTLMIRPKMALALNDAYIAKPKDRHLLKRIAFLLGTDEEVTLKFLGAFLGPSGEASLLLAELLDKTVFLDKLRDVTRDRTEFEDMIAMLSSAKSSSSSQARRVFNGSGFSSTPVQGPFDEQERDAAQLLSRISQIKDLFPDLGEGFIEACLRSYESDVETAIMHLLEDDLPPNVNELDRKMKSLTTVDTDRTARQTTSDVPLQSRRNIYDNDEFDRLQTKNAQVSKGRRASINADALLRQSLPQDQKMKVLALAYDPDDDELDDTYDQFEGQVAMDFQLNDELDEAAKPALPSIDDLLFSTFESSPGVFDRGSRKTAERGELRARTNLSDEQIEGWKVMLDREPSRARSLARKHAFKGTQDKVRPSRWSAVDEGAAAGQDGRKAEDSANRSGKAKEKSAEQIKRDRARKETRGSQRGRARGGGMRGQARPQG